MPLFETIPVDEEQIRAIVRDSWGWSLGACLKTSQNHTFVAVDAADNRHIIRVTPDPTDSRRPAVELELDLLQYLSEHNLQVCAPVPTNDGKKYVRDGSLTICAFNYATGDPVVYTEWKWMTTKEVVVALGRWLGQLHILTKQYRIERPQLAAQARHWSELHDGVLKGVPIADEDKNSESDPNKFGLIHGDINPSNYFWDQALGMPCVFDWDQLQSAWLLYDVAQPIWGVKMLAGTGSPIDRSPVHQADPEQYTEWLLEGYEPIIGEKVDRAALNRMVRVRRELYDRFCRRALSELDPESFMGKFCQYVVNWMDNNPAD